MMKHDFETSVNRQNSCSIKWDKYQGKDVIPLWVADMDFLSPPSVIEALHSRVDHGVFGYTLPPQALIKAIVRHVESEFGWRIDARWLTFLPGLVTGLNVACRATGRAGDAVITATPVYPPFLTAPVNMHRELITAPMIQDGSGRWTFDWPAMEAAVTPKTRAMILCSPHNPAGRAWLPAELEAVVSFCSRHDLVLISDEIHADLVLKPGVRHTPTAALSAEAAQRSITLMAPSKTYNIAGLGCAYAIIPDEKLRDAFVQAAEGIVPHVNLLGYTAALGAYSEEGSWLTQVREYLWGNYQLIQEQIQAMPGLKLTPLEATYLAWIDCHELNLDDPAAFFEAAGVGLSDGSDFGAPGFVRLNFGCSRTLLAEALNRMTAALAKLGN